MSGFDPDQSYPLELTEELKKVRDDALLDVLFSDTWSEGMRVMWGGRGDVECG